MVELFSQKDAYIIAFEFHQLNKIPFIRALAGVYTIIARKDV